MKALFLSLALIAGSAYAFPVHQQSAGQDMKDAGNSTKDATKKTYKKSKKGVKKGANKTAERQHHAAVAGVRKA
jgi:hypothetical protein